MKAPVSNTQMNNIMSDVSWLLYQIKIVVTKVTF